MGSPANLEEVTRWPMAEGSSEAAAHGAIGAIDAIDDALDGDAWGDDTGEPGAVEWDLEAGEPGTVEWDLEAGEPGRSDWEIDFRPTTPDLRDALELDASMSLPLIEVGTRTLMGVGARAVRAVATSGCVEARPARRDLDAAPEASHPVQPRVGGLAHGASRGKEAPPVRPPRLPAQALQQELAAFPAAPAPHAWAIAQVPAAALRTHVVRGRARARSGYRTLGISLLAVGGAALAAYVTAVL